nr:MAG TPA: hypothetical protein [Caudoviricetes sp.]
MNSVFFNHQPSFLTLDGHEAAGCEAKLLQPLPFQTDLWRKVPALVSVVDFPAAVSFLFFFQRFMPPFFAVRLCYL